MGPPIILRSPPIILTIMRAAIQQNCPTRSVIRHITISASAGSNGSISPAGTLTVNQGANQSFAISADQNYQVLDVRVDGASVGAVTSYTFTNVTQNHTISASFVSINQAPTADAGPDQTVTEGAAVTLNGSNSTDPGGSIASYQWQQIDGLTVQLSHAGTQAGLLCGAQRRHGR